MGIIKRNQTTRPRVNKIGSTQKEPKRVRLHFKSGNATILLVKNVKMYDAYKIEHTIRKMLSDMGLKLEGNIIQTQ